MANDNEDCGTISGCLTWIAFICFSVSFGLWFGWAAGVLVFGLFCMLLAVTVLIGE